MSRIQLSTVALLAQDDEGMSIRCYKIHDVTNGDTLDFASDVSAFVNFFWFTGQGGNTTSAIPGSQGRTLVFDAAGTTGLERQTVYLLAAGDFR